MAMDGLPEGVPPSDRVPGQLLQAAPVLKQWWRRYRKENVKSDDITQNKVNTAGEDAQHAKSTRTKRLSMKKSSHAEHYASRVLYARRECRVASN